MRLFSLLLLLLLTKGSLFADGFDRSEEVTPESSDPPAVAPGSDASFDKRLPPVLPGEHINDSGKTMKVWSTAGPVPVSRAPEAPEPWNENAAASIGKVDVIVDSRGQKGKHPIEEVDSDGGTGEKTLDQRGLDAGGSN